MDITVSNAVHNRTTCDQRMSVVSPVVGSDGTEERGGVAGSAVVGVEAGELAGGAEVACGGEPLLRSDVAIERPVDMETST